MATDDFKLDEKAYVEKDFSKCPKCKSEDIVGGSVEIDSNGASQDVYCNVCEFQWRDIYTLTGVEKI